MRSTTAARPNQTGGASAGMSRGSGRPFPRVSRPKFKRFGDHGGARGRAAAHHRRPRHAEAPAHRCAGSPRARHAPLRACQHLFTSNRPVEDWGRVLGDVAAVAAMLDRLLHHGHVLKCAPRTPSRTWSRPEAPRLHQLAAGGRTADGAGFRAPTSIKYGMELGRVPFPQLGSDTVLADPEFIGYRPAAFIEIQTSRSGANHPLTPTRCFRISVEEL